MATKKIVKPYSFVERLKYRSSKKEKEISKESLTIQGLDLTPKNAVIRFANGDMSAFNSQGVATWQKPSEYGEVNDIRFEDKLDALDAANEVTGMLQHEREIAERERAEAAAAASQEQQDNTSPASE